MSGSAATNPHLFRVLGFGIARQSLHNLARYRIRAKRAAEQQDMRLRAVDGIVDPATALLHTHGTPFLLVQQAATRYALGELFRQNDVAKWIRREVVR